MQRMQILLASACLLPVSSSFAGPDCGTEPAVAQHASWTSHSKPDIVDTAVAAGSFKTLAAALSAADLVEPLKGEGPFTVFAPTDAAFERLPEGTVKSLLKPENKELLQAVLTYHVVAGEMPARKVMKRTTLTSLNGQRIDIAMNDGVRVDNARVMKTDIECANGVIHVIDRVIMPSTDSILETAAKAGSFETLAAALKAAALIETLSGKGPFTVFAPTDAAFAKLSAETLDSLLKPENRDQLRSILTYHVVPGRVYADDALTAETARTVEGSRVRFKIGGGGLMVDNASIVKADVEASNGVIHVIDAVILPQ